MSNIRNIKDMAVEEACNSVGIPMYIGETFEEWFARATKEQHNEDNIFLPAMEDWEAIEILKNEILGKDWYVADPVNDKQANAYIVDAILEHYELLSCTRTCPMRKEDRID